MSLLPTKAADFWFKEKHEQVFPRFKTEIPQTKTGQLRSKLNSHHTSAAIGAFREFRIFIFNFGSLFFSNSRARG